MDEVYQRASYNNDPYSGTGSSSSSYSSSSYSSSTSSRPPQQRYRRPVGTTPPHHNLYRKSSNSSNYLTGQNFGILVAIIVIYLFQRKDGFGRLFSARRERGLLNTLMDWLLELQDYVVAYAQMAVELCRNLRLNYLGNLLEDWFPNDMNAPAARNSASSLQSNGGPRGGRRRNMVAPVASRMTTSRMPELEETDVDKLKLAAATAAADSPRKMINGPLPPSFLRDEDYPAGWLVFDPVLGVVSKVEADKYWQEQENKRRRPEEQLHQHQHEPRHQQASQPATTKQPVSPRRQTSVQRKQQYPAAAAAAANYNKSPKNGNKSTPARSIRTANVIPNASTTALPTPQTIAANG